MNRICRVRSLDWPLPGKRDNRRSGFGAGPYRFAGLIKHVVYFRAARDSGLATHRKHCVLTGAGVRYRPSQKWKSRLLGTRYKI
jgi:hypothetical protein